MKSQVSFYSSLVLIAGFFSANTASAATQTISARAWNGNSTSGNAIVASSAKVTCTQASGGTNTRCFIQSPGWSGLIKAGQSIGTSGAGNVSLSCTGSYPVGGSLSCSALIDDTACSPEQTISASSQSGSSNQDFAAIKSPAVVECTQATGGGSTSRCYIQSPGFNGSLSQGQSIVTSGAGTVSLLCNGSYPVGGGLSCRAQIGQVCP